MQTIPNKIIGESSDNPIGYETTGLQSLLATYRQTIKDLLSKPSISDVSFQDFERFKQEFGTIAFTCPVWSCSFALIGFRNDAELVEHQATHQRIICNAVGCLYPAFSSVAALNRHRSKHHEHSKQGLRRTKIRKQSREGSILTTTSRKQKEKALQSYPSTITRQDEHAPTLTTHIQPGIPSAFSETRVMSHEILNYFNFDEVEFLSTEDEEFFPSINGRYPGAYESPGERWNRHRRPSPGP